MMIRIRQIARFIAVLSITLFACAATSSAQAPLPASSQAPASGIEQIEPGELTRTEIRELMSRLSDDDVRRLLLEQLDKSAVADAPQQQASLSEQIQANGKIVRDRLAQVLAAAPYAPNAISLLGRRLDEAGGAGKALMALAIVIVAGIAAAWLWRRLLRTRQDRLSGSAARARAVSPVAVYGNAFATLVFRLSGVLVFYIAAMVLMLAFWSEPAPLRQFLSTYIAAITGISVVVAIADFLLPGDRPAYRLPPLSDRSTRQVKGYVLAAAVVWTGGLYSLRLLLEYGADSAAHTFLASVVASVLVGILVAMFFSIRDDVAGLIRGRPDETGGWRPVRNLVAGIWHLIASAYVLLIWVLSLGRLLIAGQPIEGVSSGLFGLVLFVAVPAIDILVGRFLTAGMGRDSALAGAIRRTVRVFLIVGAAAIFLYLWGLDIARLEAAGIAGWLTSAVIDVGVVALIGYAAWQLVRAYFDSLLEDETASEDAGNEAEQASGEEMGGTGATRAATLIPLLRAFAMATIAVMAVLTVLAGFGVDIGPLLAGAGVVGIAIGFGAQTLVRDIVSGIFFLIDDAFRTGEYIEIGSVKGTVERISVRSLRLRHHRGAVHTVPFGEIQTLTNYSRDWVIMKLPLRLNFDTDPQHVKRIIKRISAEIAEDPLLSPSLLEPPKSQGVLQMDETGMTLRVKFKSKPGQQFTIRRELLHRIRAAFEEEGIRFASNREVIVRVAGDDPDNPPDEKTVEEAGAAAARTMIQRNRAEDPAAS